MGNFNEGWYVAYVRPLKEKSIAGNIARSGIQNFLPLTKQVRQWHDRKKVIQTPLFPGYLFVHLSSMTEFTKCINTEGVIYFLKEDKKPIVVRQTIMDHIILIANSDSVVDVIERTIKKGERILIESGALAGVIGEVIQYNGAERLLIRVDILNKCLLVNIPTQLCGLCA